MDLEDLEKEKRLQQKAVDVKVQKLLDSVKETAAKNKGVYFFEENNYGK